MQNVIVVGAGIAGLSSAIYCQRSGLKVTLIEKHNVMGGMCTSWSRKGYLFEGSLHWLMGTRKDTLLYSLWKKTGALNDDIPIYYSDILNSVKSEDKVLHIFRDIDMTIKELIKASPEDEIELKKLGSAVKNAREINVPIFNIKGLKTLDSEFSKIKDIYRTMIAFKRIKRYTKMSAGEFRNSFKLPAIRQLLHIVPDEFEASNLIISLSNFCFGDGGYPEGGSLSMIERMKKTFENLGGEVLLKTNVDKVLVSNGVARGVKLEQGGKVLYSDAVIIATDTAVAIKELFNFRISDKWISQLYSNLKPSMCTFIGVGVSTNIEDLVGWRLSEPIQFGNEVIKELNFKNYNNFKDYAPEGSTSLTCCLMGNTYDYWKEKKKEGTYFEAKKELAKKIELALIKEYPEVYGKIDVIDIATPLTYERYTNSYKGSWMNIVSVGDRKRAYPGYLKNIKGVYFAGQRIMPPGGMPSALITGRRAAQMVCKYFNCVFR